MPKNQQPPADVLADTEAANGLRVVDGYRQPDPTSPPPSNVPAVALEQPGEGDK